MIRHVLKDGTILSDISGHIVREKDAKAAYAVMERINEKQKRRKQA